VFGIISTWQIRLPPEKSAEVNKPKTEWIYNPLESNSLKYCTALLFVICNLLSVFRIQFYLEDFDSKLRVSKVAVCCFSWGICYDFYGVKTAEGGF
jgi:hypothetical protein